MSFEILKSIIVLSNIPIQYLSGQPLAPKGYKLKLDYRACHLDKKNQGASKQHFEHKVGTFLKL